MPFITVGESSSLTSPRSSPPDVLPVAVTTGQESPVPPVENATIWSKLRVWKVPSLCGWRFSAPQIPA
jgi:hypothetical protein